MLKQLLQITILLAPYLNVDTCKPNTYPDCHSWGACSKPCGGGQRSRICESCVLSIDKRFYEDCNTFCKYGHPYYSNSCHCPLWRTGECCEMCRHIYIAHCVSGQKACGGSPDGIKCTKCYDPYFPAGYGNGCQECPEINRCKKRHCTAPSNTICLECEDNDVFFQNTTGGKKCQSKPLPPKEFQYFFDNIAPSFLWQKDFNGGLEQSFVIQTSIVGTGQWTNHTKIHETDQQYRINETFYLANFTGLQPGVYTARIIASNLEGDSELVNLTQTFEILEEDTTKQFNATLLITLEAQMTEQLQDTSSSSYKTFTKTLETEINKYIRGQFGEFAVEFLDLRSPQVTLSFRVICTIIWFNNPMDVMNAIATSLQHKIINGKHVIKVQFFLFGEDVPCPSETTEHLTYGKFTWPVTHPGASSYIQCQYQLHNNQTVKNASRNCERQSDNSGLWKQPFVSSCPHADENSRELQTLAESDINEGNIEKVSSSLNELTSNWQHFASAQITWSVDIIYRISNLSNASPKSVSTTLDAVNKMLFIKSDILQQAEMESESLNRLVKGIQMLFEAVSVKDGDYQTVKENIAGIATAVRASSFEGLTMSYRNLGNKTLTNTKITYTKEDEATGGDRSGIVLPRTMFDTFRQEERNSIDKITLLVFKDPKLFSSITQTRETKLIQSENGDIIPAERKINSNIIGASVPATQVKDLQTPVAVTLFHLYAGNNVSCVYWDVDSSTWSSDGCNVKKTTDDFTVCHCNHLTNFALLMDVYSTGASSLALSVISYVGCGLSLIGVFLTLITYLKFRKLRRGNPSKILMNLCLSIGLVDIVFLVGVQEYSVNSESGCKIVAILLHYFLLTSMSWMAVEAFYMYLALVKVFDAHVAHFQLKSSLFGWCTPLLEIGITLGINKSENYGLQPGGICWLNRIPFYAAFLAPVCFLLLVNTMTYLLVIRRIVNKGTNKNMTKSDKSSTIVRLRGAVSVLVLLGLTWAFGVLAFDGVGEAFHYIFALLNSLQGFFIFVFYCTLRKEARQCWKQALPCLKSPYEKDTLLDTRNKGDSSSGYSSKTKTLNLISKESKPQDSESVEDERKNNTESTCQISSPVECEGITNTESKSQLSNSVEEKGRNSTESTSLVGRSVEDERKNYTVFRGNWYVQVPAPKQKSSFV